MKRDDERSMRAMEVQPERRAVRAESRLQLLIDSVRDYAIFMLDPTGRVETWNFGAALIKGYKANEIIGEPLDRFYPREDLAAGKPARLLATARAQGYVEDEGWRIRKDGTRFWADVVISALRESTGELVGFVKVTRDLTERKLAEEQRLQQEHRFRILVENARDHAIFMLDTRGYIATWNEGAERIKGYRADEIIGLHFSQFYPAEEATSGKCERELEIALAEGRYEEEGWRVRKDGSQFWANVMIAPLHDGAGKHIGFSKITKDLTERRAAEQQRLELAHSQEALRLRDEFVSIASHELRTPLVALQLQIESLQGQANLDAKQLSKLERAGRNVDRLAELITTLLDVSRLSTGRLSLVLERVDLGALVADVIERLEETARAARCEVSANIASGIVGKWDPLRVEQIASNLLANAFEYAAGSGVELTLSREGGQAVLRVEDRGPGIDAALLEKIFERYERASSGHHKGMGLGLYVAREIAIAHGGMVVASNREGSGATFEVRLPIREK